MLYKFRNFCAALPDFKPGDVFEGCNFAQQKAHTALTTVKGLTFRDCNLMNCDLPPDAVEDGCLIHHADIIPEKELSPLDICNQEIAITQARLAELQKQKVDLGKIGGMEIEP
jgi:hypothetical protein